MNLVLDRRAFIASGLASVAGVYLAHRAIPVIAAPEPRPKGARFIALGQPVAKIVNAAPAGSKFVIAKGIHKVAQSIRLRRNVELWGEHQAGLRPIRNKWGYGHGGYVNTIAHSVRPSTRLVFAAGIKECIDGDKLSGQKLVDLEIDGGTATGGPGTWGASGRSVSKLSGLVSRCLVHHGEINGIGWMKGLVKDTEIHSCGTKSKGFAAGAIKTVQHTTIQRCFIHDNSWNGAWCDRHCPSFDVLDSFIVDNVRAAVRYEVSRGAPGLIQRNLLWRNGRGGVWLTASQNVDISDNDLRDNIGSAVLLENGPRGECHDAGGLDDGHGQGWPCDNLFVHDNALNGGNIVTSSGTGCAITVGGQGSGANVEKWNNA